MRLIVQCLVITFFALSAYANVPTDLVGEWKLVKSYCGDETRMLEGPPFPTQYIIQENGQVFMEMDIPLLCRVRFVTMSMEIQGNQMTMDIIEEEPVVAHCGTDTPFVSSIIFRF